MANPTLRLNPLPEVEAPAQKAWHEGWWTGIAVGLVSGIAVGMVVAQLARVAA